jgi:EmrB/QacA subfamily drug resistance transporter
VSAVPNSLDDGSDPIDFDDPRRWWTLGVLCLSLSIVMVANSSLNVALPSIARELDASDSALQWIVDSYALVFAGMLFAAGAIGDRFGRKGALQGGLVLFLVAAAAGVVADSSAEVIAARAIMGLAAAFVMPSTLSILSNVFSPAERPRAIALWAGISAGGAALGPPISGLLLEHFWWGSVFLVNIPLVAAALLAGWRLVPRSRNPEQTRIDVPGAGLSIVAVGAIVFAIIEAPHAGWLSLQTLGVGALAVVLMVGFIAWEFRNPAPMLDPRLFRDRRFSVASAGIAAAFFTMFGTFFLLTQLLQLVHGLSPLAAGLAILPVSLVLMIVAPRAPMLVERYGIATVVPAGLAITAGGLALLGTFGASGDAWRIYVGFIPMAVGMAVTMSPLTSMIMSSVPPSRAGVGSAMNDTTRELGGALGVAVLGSLLATVYSGDLGAATRALPADLAAQAESGLAGALQAADSLGGPAGAALADAGRSAFVDGLRVATLVAAGFLLVGAFAARRLLPRSASGADERTSGATPAASNLAHPTAAATNPTDATG